MFILLTWLWSAPATGTAKGRPAPDGDSTLIAALLQHLSGLQLKADNYYYQGMFPALRSWAFTPSDLKPDNSIFFTGLIVFTLRQLEPFFTPKERAVSDSIIARALLAYPHFANTKGFPTYNFWPNDRVEFFPNSTLLGAFKESKQIADDLDDTSILWLGTGIPDSTARRLKGLMEEHANGRIKSVRNSYDATRGLPAYSAWFSEKTPIEFDAGVMTNVLYFVWANHLPKSAVDTASVDFLEYVVKERKYWKEPAYASSYYPRTPVLLYHLARLQGRFPQEQLRPYIPQLKADARKALAITGDVLDQVILGTTLIRLGDTASLPDLPAAWTTASLEQDPFVFYIANLSSLFANPVRRAFLYNPLCIYQFYSPSYNDALVIEYLVLRRSLDKVNPPAAMSSIRNPSRFGR